MCNSRLLIERVLLSKLGMSWHCGYEDRRHVSPRNRGTLTEDRRRVAGFSGEALTGYRFVGVCGCTLSSWMGVGGPRKDDRSPKEDVERRCRTYCLALGWRYRDIAQ